MKKTKPLHISKLIGSSNALEQLVSSARHNDQLLVSVRSRLPDPLGDHCVGALLSNQNLTLFVDSPTWTTRLRFLAEELKQQLAPLNIFFHQLKVKTVHPHLRHKIQSYRPAELSDENAALIKQCAETVSEPGLRAALSRLGNHKIKS